MEFPAPIAGLWRDAVEPDMLWQLGALVLCLGLAWLVDRLVGRRAARQERAWPIGRRGLKRLVFPLVALVLVLLLRAVLRPWLHVSLMTLAVPLLASLAIIRAVFFVLRHSLGGVAWLAVFERLFALLVWALVALHIVGWLPELIDMLEGVGFAVGRQRLNLWLLLQGLATVAVTLLLALWLGSAIEARLMAAAGLDDNLRVVFARLSKAVLVMLAVLIGLPLVGIDLTTLSVFGGALGVGLGFGLQKIASNYVSGFIILLDHSIRIGNIIAVGPDRGQVTKITTRYTVLKGLTGIEAIVPNEVLVGSVVQNESYTDPRVRIALPVHVSYGADPDRAMALMVAAARAQSRVLADPPPGAYLVGFGESGINLELGFWIADPQEGTLQLRSDINLAVWRDFKHAGIGIPSPQREVRLLQA